MASKFDRKFQAEAEETNEITEKEPEYYSEDSEGPKMDVEYISLLNDTGLYTATTPPHQFSIYILNALKGGFLYRTKILPEERCLY